MQQADQFIQKPDKSYYPNVKSHLHLSQVIIDIFRQCHLNRYPNHLMHHYLKYYNPTMRCYALPLRQQSDGQK